MNDSILIAETLCTRLCHDITGPIGAVNNGAEFLEEENFSMNEDALKLITESAKEAVLRLQFYRQAYGRVKDMGDACLEDRKALVQGYLRQTRVKLDWPDTHTDAADVALSQGMAKLLLNMVVIATASLIRGGTLSIRLDKDESGKRITVSGEGDTVKVDEAVAAALREDVAAESVSPKTVQAYVTRQLSLKVGAPLEVDFTGTTIRLSVAKHEGDHASLLGEEPAL